MQSYISKYLLGIKDTIPNKKRESDDFINLETELSYLLSTKEWNKTEEELSSQLARRVAMIFLRVFYVYNLGYKSGYKRVLILTF